MQINDEEIFAIMLEIRKELRELSHTMDVRFANLNLELHGYRTALKVFRWVGAIILAIITLRFGDIKNLL